MADDAIDQQSAYEAVQRARQVMEQRCSPGLDELTLRTLAEVVCTTTLSDQVRESARRLLIAAKEAL